MDKAKLLMVEDDSTISQELKDELVSWGYHVDLVEDFTNIMAVFRETDPHLVYMDINLPFNNGYYWCQQIRKVSHVPIIFISSRSDQMDQIMAMQMGGDDYIEKPFNLSLLVAKTQALLRRTYDFVPENYDELKAGELTLSISESVMKWQGQEIRLTHTELLILKELFQKPGHFISRNDLIEACWQADAYIDENTLSVNISRLRKKMKEIDLPPVLGTKKNGGYRLMEVDS